MDDVPERTIDDIEREERDRLARLARITGGDTPSTLHDSLRNPHPEPEIPMQGKKCAVVCEQTNEVFPSVARLVAHLKVDRSLIERALNGDGRIGDFTYRRLDLPTTASTSRGAGAGSGPAIAPADQDGGHLAGPESLPRVRSPRSGAARPANPSKRATALQPPVLQPAQGVPAGRAPRGKVRMVYIEAESSDAVLLLVSQLLRGE